jgi:hypothetical protein
MAVGKQGGKSLGRIAYLNKLAGEIITGEPMESLCVGRHGTRQADGG